jgi:2-keto-3-deoxy-L-rhamnonate aldolase RhmA
VLDEHRRRLVEAAGKHGKAVAMLTDSTEGVRQMIALGATIINYSSDAAILGAARPVRADDWSSRRA